MTYPKGKLILEEKTMTVTLTLNEITVEKATDILALVKGESAEDEQEESKPARKAAPPVDEPVDQSDEVPCETAEYTIEEVRKAFAAYGKAKGKDAAKAVLARFGAAKVTELKAEQYAAVMKEVS